jgi:hypothetical protein
LIPSLGKALLGIGILSTAMALAADSGNPEPQPLREFQGTTAEDVSGPIPEELIQDEAAYVAAWKQLGLEESPGVVDFATEVVFSSTTRGSRISLRLRNEGEGKLQVMGISTRDIRPGLRYVFGVLSKTDWKMINDTALR